MKRHTLDAFDPILLDAHKYMKKTRRGNIKTTAMSKSGLAVKLTIFVLLGLTLYAFITFDYADIDFAKAISGTFDNLRLIFGQPRLKSNSIQGILNAMLVTFFLSVLSTIFGTIIGLFGAIFCAKNLANPKIALIVRSLVAFIRAIPTILWVLIFAISDGLGSMAAVAGLSFHSIGYLAKAYSEAFEEVDSGTIEALKANGASFWQIIFQAILPCSLGYMIAWTFMRFEHNLFHAVAVGAAAGAGGIGFDLFMAGKFYFDLRELGFITYIIMAVIILLEIIATRVKAAVR